MIINTKHFGEIDLDESKIIHFDQGILGFETFTDYTILFDEEEGKRPDISWLQSVEEPSLAIPVVSPLLVKPDYNLVVEDELLISMGEMSEENTVAFVSVTVPAEIEKISANLKAPFIINADTRKGAQIILDQGKYEVKYYFYEEFKKNKVAKGDK